MAKGHTNNPNGRPKGTPNKITQDMRQWLAAVIDDNREQIVEDLQALEPRDRLMILERLMQYVIPKQQAVSADLAARNDRSRPLVERLAALVGGEEPPPMTE